MTRSGRALRAAALSACILLSPAAWAGQPAPSVGAGATARKAADFPNDWYIEPNLPSKMNGLFPDSPAKVQADAEKRFYRP